MTLGNFIQRCLFNLTMKIARLLTRGHFDYRAMRRGVAWLERAVGKRRLDVEQTSVVLGQCSAAWFDVAETRSDHVILYIHGGAFVFETPSLHSALLASLCRKTGTRGFMLNYRLAPEFPYPAATDDCLEAYSHLLTIGICADKIVIIGDSAGGNLTLVTLLRIRAAGLPMPAGAIALSPLTDATGSSDSMRRNAPYDPMFDPSGYDALIPLYVPNAQQRFEPWASPLYGDLDGLPPIHLVVGSSEMLLDDSVRFAIKCPSATLEIWHGMPHVFPAFNFFPEAREAQTRLARCITSMYQGRVEEAGSARLVYDPLQNMPLADSLRPFRD